MKNQFTLSLLVCATIAQSATPTAQSAKPNIIVILADDLGYGDVHCLNPKRGKITTPNIDRLATQGMTFTDAHSSSSVCTPSRYSILTGRYNWRTRLQKDVFYGMSDPPLIAKQRLTVAGLLKQNGYATACIGKWHLGMTMPKLLTEGRIENSPITRGFDYFFGISASLGLPPNAFIENDRFTEVPTAIREIGFGKPGPTAPGFEAVDVLPTLTRKSVEWIEHHKSQPFFLYMALNSPHTPLNPAPEWRGKSGLGTYADFVMQTDWTIGEISRALDRVGIAENTIVIVTSDNGCAPYVGTTDKLDPMRHTRDAVHQLEAKGHFPSAQFCGYKSDAWDGGHRIPFIVRWPSVIKPGTKCSQLVGQLDLMATCADIIGGKIPSKAGEDSVSLLPLLRGADKPVRETLVHHSINGNFAVRDGKWKLVFCHGSGGWSSGAKTPSVQLYDMSADEGEQHNLQAEHPDIVKRLAAKLKKIVADGRSTPGPKQQNDVPVDIFKKGK